MMRTRLPKSVLPTAGCRATQHLIVIVGFFMTGCGVAEPEAPPAFTVQGTVWADPTGSTPSLGQAIEGAAVTLAALPGILSPARDIAAVTSGTGGHFEIRADQCGAVLRAESPAYHVEWIEGWDGFCSRDRVTGVVIHMQLDEEPESTLAFVSLPSATSEECLARPPGTVCIGYSDGYVWMVTTSWIDGHRSGGVYQGQPVEAAIGSHAEYHHVLGTDLVAEVPK